MKHYGKSEEVLIKMLSAFEAGDIPRALAQVFIRRKDDVPCRSWSISNQMLVALFGHTDARGYRQWQDAGRQVKKGEHAFNILGPVHVKARDTDADGKETEEYRLVGFKSIPVFGLSQTEGDALPDVDPDAQAWLEGLPLIAVARSWGLSVASYNGREGAALGKYSSGLSTIALGVENLSTWAHELVHAADDKAGGLHSKGREYDEVVAELGGAVMLECLGRTRESDRGGCWNYLRAWAPTKDPLTACYKVITRVCKAVDLIVGEAERLEAQRQAA